MAAIALLPGYGSAYTSESFDSNATIGADTIDCSKCASLLLQVATAGGPTGNIDIEQSSLNGKWAQVVTDMALTDGTVVRLDPTDGPFGLIRINATDITAGTVVLTIVGFPLPVRW